MGRFNDLTGQRFERLTVLYRDANDKNNNTMWVCRCDCGTVLSVRGSCLTHQKNKSCGCYLKERVTKHGARHTRLYTIWSHIKQRCENPRHNKYPIYGARGIKMCDEWRHDFGSFMKWAKANNYSDNLTIDRIDSDGDYEPSNCRWATWSEQNRNRRPYKHKERKGAKVL